MLKYLIKNFGLTALALCILVSSITLAQSIDGFKQSIKHNTRAVNQVNACQMKMSDLLQPIGFMKGK